MGTVDREKGDSLAVGGDLKTLRSEKVQFSAPNTPRVQFVRPEPHDLVYRIARAARDIFSMTVNRARGSREKSHR
jgi:hypothetical protein